MEACIFTGIQHRDVTRFQKPPFSYIHMSAAKWQVQNLYTESVSEKMHFRWPFLLDTCGQWAKTRKKSQFLATTDMCGWGLMLICNKYIHGKITCRMNILHFYIISGGCIRTYCKSSIKPHSQLAFAPFSGKQS